jgi:hypothetical protein
LNLCVPVKDVRNEKSARSVFLRLLNYGSERCPLFAKVTATRPSPADPKAFPKYLCYSHLSSFAKASNGQFIVDKIIEGEK